MSRPQRTRISAYALLVENGRLLLVRCSDQSDAAGQWTLPGGGIDFGEDPAHAAVREVREETGLDITLGKLLAIDSRFHALADSDHHAIRIIYAGHVVGGTLRSEIGGSTDLCEWIAFEQIPNLPLVELANVGVQLAKTL